MDPDEQDPNAAESQMAYGEQERQSQSAQQGQAAFEQNRNLRAFLGAMQQRKKQATGPQPQQRLGIT